MSTLSSRPRPHTKFALDQVGARAPRDGWVLADPLPVSARTQRALMGVVRALLPPAPAPRPAGIEELIEVHVRSMLQYMPVGPRLGFLVIVRLLEWSPVLRCVAARRLSSLRPEQANEVLAGLSASRFWLLRLLMLGPKALVMSTYFDQDEVHEALQYDPRAFLRERVARREVLIAEPRFLKSEAS